jgi:hypothetical protein
VRFAADSALEGAGFEPSVPGYGGDEVALRGSDCREAAAIFTARDDPMLSRAASAASATTGLARAMRPRITRHSSSATAVVESITAAEGASRSNRNRLGRDSVRPIRPSAQAASLATTRSASSSSLVSRGMAAGDLRLWPKGLVHGEATLRLMFGLVMPSC